MTAPPLSQCRGLCIVLKQRADSAEVSLNSPPATSFVLSAACRYASPAVLLNLQLSGP